jgi:hypothetical protein
VATGAALLTMAGDDRTFFQKHKAGITAVWQRDECEWWHAHYIRTYGHEPPRAWWVVNPRLAGGGQIAPGMMRAFGYFHDAVRAAYFREMEDRYRLEAGLPARGEGWVSETYLYRCLVEVLPEGIEIVREARPEWLSPQRLDIFVPSLALAIEHQGVQHYEPVEIFGGEAGLARRIEMDQRKRAACAAASVQLVEWRYDDEVHPTAVRDRLRALGLLPG